MWCTIAVRTFAAEVLTQCRPFQTFVYRTQQSTDLLLTEVVTVESLLQILALHSSSVEEETKDTEIAR